MFDRDNDAAEPIAETRRCVDCSTDFNITVGEKEWYEKNQMTLPKRCKPCRKAKKERNQGGGGGNGGGGGGDHNHGGGGRGRRGRRDGGYDS